MRINTQFPITAPLPIATVSSDSFSPLYSPHWALAPPDTVIDPQAGRVGQLALDLPTIARSSIDKACLLQFLLARANCASVLLEVFSKSLDDTEGLPVLARMFDLLHAAVARSLLTRRAYSTSAAAAALANAPTRAGADDQPMGGGASSVGTSSMSASTSASMSGSTSTDAISPQRAGDGADAGEGGVGASGCASDGAGPSGAVSPPGIESPLATQYTPRVSDSASATPRDTVSTPLGSGSLSALLPAGARDGPPDSAVFVEHVFGPAVARLPTPPNAHHPRRRYIVAVLTEYLHSQQQHALTLDVSAGVLLLTVLEEQRDYYQLHQLVQYHLVPDSLDLAYRLLALEGRYPPGAPSAQICPHLPITTPRTPPVPMTFAERLDERRATGRAQRRSSQWICSNGSALWATTR